MINYSNKHSIRLGSPYATDIQEFVAAHNGKTEWRTDVVVFRIADKELVTHRSGSNSALFRIWRDNITGRLTADSGDLLNFFGIIRNPSVTFGTGWEVLTYGDRFVRVNVIIVNGYSYRDITFPLRRMLDATAREARKRAEVVRRTLGGREFAQIREESRGVNEAVRNYVSNLRWFYEQVTHGRAWDLKRPAGWTKTMNPADFLR